MFSFLRGSTSYPHTSRVTGLALAAVTLCMPFSAAFAQAGGSLTGTVTDAKGDRLPKATITARPDGSGKIYTATTDASGGFTLTGLMPGPYSLEVSAPGFAILDKKAIQVAGGAPTTLTLKLDIASASDAIQVDANETKSVAAALAPMDALLNETSARTEITSSFIQNFTSPVADYGEAVQMAPSTFTLNGNGVGLGQSKTYFRGFPDGDYDIDFDGIPFYDTNTPTHHSWAFFPTQFLGGIDFDRSPGTASTIGPTPFGGSIHLLSKDLSPLDNVRATFSGGSYNTYLYDVAYDSGAFGPSHKFNAQIDVHHLQSHGYQSLNNQTRNAGDLKFEYKIGPKTILTGFSGVIWLDANTPNFSATRCQMYGTAGLITAANPNPCGATAKGVPAGTLLPYTGAGINFLLTNNSDPYLYLDTQYNRYHVPTDFEYVGLHKEMRHNLQLDVKGYTYNYDNSEPYANAVPITDSTTINGSNTYLGLAVQNCSVPTVVAPTATSGGSSILPCGVDKYNSYRKYGETSTLSQVSHLGVLRTGIWYEWAKTNRHQFPSDPANGFKDQLLPNFSELFWTNSYQPFGEYEFHFGKATFTPGIKFAYYTISTKQFADNGKTIGNLGTGTPIAGTTFTTPGTGNPNAFVVNGGSYFAALPSGAVNYRVKNNLSVYGQIATGSIVPPSSVFDYAQPATTTGTFLPVVQAPKQQKNTTYQFGTVYKLKNVTFDADYYHIYFDNSYTCTTTIANQNNDNVCSAGPASITQGLEGESNIYLSHGLSVYLNASYDHATYTGSLTAACAPGQTAAQAAACLANPLVVTTPSGLNVAQTPSDVETEGLTYQHKAYDFGFFNKRVGTYYLDNGNGYHNQFTINPFSQADIYLNYTMRGGGRFDQTKFRFSFNNLFNSSNQTGITFAGKATGQTIVANGTTYTDPFTAVNPQTAIAGQDSVSILPGRSLNLTVTFGASPGKR